MKKILLGFLISVFLITQGYCGDVSKSHIFVDGEILTAALLNTGFDEIISELNDIDGDNFSSSIAISTSGTCLFSGTTTISGTFATTSTSNSIGNGGSDVLTFNTPGGITYTPAATWTFTGAQTVSGTWANLGAVTTVDINGGTLDGVIIGGASAAAATVTTLTTGGKFTAGANEIEGSNFDITGGTITGITDLAVAEGGTGASTLTDGGILLGSGTDAITALGVATNGQIPIGDGTTDPVLATITGTADEVDVANGAGTITIGIVNPLATSKGGTGATAAANAANGVIIADANAYVATSNLPHGSQLFTSSGTFTAPTGITKVFITGVGGGGGGGGTDAVTEGGGGGGGEAVIKKPYTVIAGNNYTVTINGGGTAGSNGTGGTGGTSVFDSLTLAGGIGGTKGSPGQGGLGVGGGLGTSINFDASASVSTAAVPGGIGSIKGGNGAAGVAGNSYPGGGGGGTPFGTGGAGGDNDTDGFAGVGYGSGGGGASHTTQLGGAGAAGFVLVEW